MEKRKLGRSGLETPPLIFGGNVFGWTVDEPQSFALLDQFVDGGFNTIDTADVYSKWKAGNRGGESETIIGNWLAKRPGVRARVIIASKCGMEMPGLGQGLSRAWIVRAVEDSLKRLKTDYIDLYQSHRDDPSTPLEETMAAHAELVKAGKIRHVGGSNYDGPRLKASLEASRKAGIPRYETLQNHYNLMERGEVEGDVQKLCVAEGIGIVPYYSLASGFLTGKYRTEADVKGRARAAGAGKYLNAKGLAVLKALDEAASAHKVTPAQVALAWLAAQPAVTAPIASATTKEQLADIMASARLKLSTDALARLGEAGA